MQAAEIGNAVDAQKHCLKTNRLIGFFNADSTIHGYIRRAGRTAPPPTGRPRPQSVGTDWGGLLALTCFSRVRSSPPLAA